MFESRKIKKTFDKSNVDSTELESEKFTEYNTVYDIVQVRLGMKKHSSNKH